MIGAVELVADIVEMTHPREMRERLLSGLVRDLGMAAAMLWTPLGRDEGLAMVDSVGLAGDLAESLATWPHGSTADRIARATPRSPETLQLCRVPLGGPDGTLYLMALPEPASDVLGVLTREPVTISFTRLLAALARSFASALRQAAIVSDNQHIIDAMVGELRPGDVVLPEGYEVGHLYRSATTNVAIGGDLYDWFCTDRAQLGIAVGDVSGKGMQAASRTAMAVHSLRAFALPGASPHVVAKMLNTVVTGQSAVESFVTLIYLRIDPDSGATEFVLAGHPPPIVLRGGRTEVLDVPSDVPLGVDATASFELHETTLDRGDRVVLYTDGVTEARADGDGRLLGLAGLVELLDGLRDGSPQQIADGVWDAVQRHTGGDTTDDCAVLVLRRT